MRTPGPKITHLNGASLYPRPVLPLCSADLLTGRVCGWLRRLNSWEGAAVLEGKVESCHHQPPFRDSPEPWATHFHQQERKALVHGATGLQ